ncbi:retrotransposon protein, putative, ty1-copia subclass [Tanacetum coccineum]
MERSSKFCGFQLGFQGGGERVISYLHFGCDQCVTSANLLAWTTQATCPTSLKGCIPLLDQHLDENLLKEDVSTVLVWVKLHGVPVTAFSEDGLSAIATKLGTPLMLDSYTSDMCMQSWGRSSYARAMIELRADVELKDNIVVAMPKITGEGHYICNVRVEYEWKPPRCAPCKVFGHIHEECLKNTGACEKKTLKKPSQTSRGVPVGPKIGFKPQKEYRRVPKNPTASSSGNKKKGVEPTIEVSNSNPFEVLNSVDNDVELELLTSRQAILVDEVGNPLKNIEYPGDYDSEDEVASVDNDMVRSMASEWVGFGTQSLLEQWRDSYGNGDYDEDPYDDDMYEVDRYLEERDQVLHELKVQLAKAQQIMKTNAYKHRRDVQIEIGEEVYLKLRPYRQPSVVNQNNVKLAPRYFRPFDIVEKLENSRINLSYLIQLRFTRMGCVQVGRKKMDEKF